MPEESVKTSKRWLEPQERISEVLFGLIMVLAITSSLGVATAKSEDVHTMLMSALGCNLAWGIIDGVLYLLGCLADKGRNLVIYKAVRRATDIPMAQQLIAETLPRVVAATLQPAELETIRQRLMQLPEPPKRARLSWSDVWCAKGVCLLVFLSTFPVVLPFLFMENAVLAMRISNGIAITMLFITGAAYGRCMDRSPWLFGMVMVVLGGALVALTMALGG